MNKNHKNHRNKVKRAIIIVGPTAAGKNFLVKSLNEDYKEVISITNRDIRDGEIPDVNYIYLKGSVGDHSEFVERIDFGGFSYGIRIKEFNEVISSNKIPVFIVEQNGVEQVSKYIKENHIECLVDIIFLDVPRFDRYQNLLEDYATKHNLLIYDRRCQTYALDRLVRNGDNIGTEFKKVWPEIKDKHFEKSITEFTNIDNTIQSEKLLGYNLYVIKSKDELSDFIVQYCNKYNNKYNNYLKESNIYIL